MFFRNYVSIMTSVVFLISWFAAAVAATCNRDKLLAGAEAYIEAQSSGTLASLQNLLSASNFTYRENNKETTIASGILSKGLKLDHNRTTADTIACATFTELISTAGPYVIGTQLRHTPDGAQITTIDSIIATTGSWFFNAKTTLSYITDEDWSALSVVKQSSRDVLKAAADAYLDMWSNATAINNVPWGNPCARTEGSMHFTPSCKEGAPTGGGAENSNRRYTIDETVGSCDVLCSFGGQMPDSHEFRLEGGKLRYVHTITV